jgi:hypothetical protein
MKIINIKEWLEKHNAPTGKIIIFTVDKNGKNSLIFNTDNANEQKELIGIFLDSILAMKRKLHSDQFNLADELKLVLSRFTKEYPPHIGLAIFAQDYVTGEHAVSIDDRRLPLLLQTVKSLVKKVQKSANIRE